MPQLIRQYQFNWSFKDFLMTIKDPNNFLPEEPQ